MVSFEDFDLDGGGPIYLRLIAHIKSGVAAGLVADGDELPSRRALSALLGVNPNTVQKAYSILEEEGLISSRSGAKSYVTLSGEGAERVRAELIGSAARTAAAAMKALGLTPEEAAELIKSYWKEDGER